MILTLGPDEIDELSLDEDPSMGIPPGSKLQFEGGVSVVLRPGENPYVHGPVWERGFVYAASSRDAHGL